MHPLAVHLHLRRLACMALSAPPAAFIYPHGSAARGPDHLIIQHPGDCPIQPGMVDDDDGQPATMLHLYAMLHPWRHASTPCLASLPPHASLQRACGCATRLSMRAPCMDTCKRVAAVGLNATVPGKPQPKCLGWCVVMTTWPRWRHWCWRAQSHTHVRRLQVCCTQHLQSILALHRATASLLCDNH